MISAYLQCGGEPQPSASGMHIKQIPCVHVTTTYYVYIATYILKLKKREAIGDELQK